MPKVFDTAYFVTEGAKMTLLNPTSSFDDFIKGLKLDISDSPPAEYFICSKCTGVRLRSVSIYYDSYSCKRRIIAEVVQKRSKAAASSNGVFTKQTASFLISNDLHILPKEAEFFQIIQILGITNTDAEPIKVDFGLSELMKLLLASLTSPTPLSDIILNKTTQMNTQVVGCCPKRDDPKSWNFCLKVMIQKSTGKLLYAQTSEQFVESLFSLLIIPLGGVERLLAGSTCFKAINNLYRSTTKLIDVEHFNSIYVKDRLMIPLLPHGCMPKSLTLPLTEEDFCYSFNVSMYSSVKFPKGQGIYLQRPQRYLVKDDLSVEPYCFDTILSSLREQEILISDVEEVELKIGLNEALSILKASLTSSSALSDALLPRKPDKQPKREL